MSVLESTIMEEFDIHFYQDGMYQAQYDYLSSRRLGWQRFVKRRYGKISDAAFHHEAEEFFKATDAELDEITKQARKKRVKRIRLV